MTGLKGEIPCEFRLRGEGGESAIRIKNNVGCAHDHLLAVKVRERPKIQPKPSRARCEGFSLQRRPRDNDGPGQVTTPDKAIAARILAGDEVAFRRLFYELFPKLYRFAMLRLDCNRDDVCEVVQQTYCRAFEKLAYYRGEASLFGWMCQICRNAIADLRRQRQRLVTMPRLPTAM